MKGDISINHEIVIPADEIEITASKASGPGGQHVQRTSTRITLRWNIQKSRILTDAQKERLLTKLKAQLTRDGDLIIHASTTRSAEQNKKIALQQLAKRIYKALHVPKKRMATRIPKAIQEARLQKKSHRSEIKKLRRKKHYT